MHSGLQGWLKTPDDDIDLANIHSIVQVNLPTTTHMHARFVDQAAFEKNVGGQKKQFCDVMRSAGQSTPHISRDELEKLITYGMCLYYETSQITNMFIQMHSGLFHPGLSPSVWPSYPIHGM